jgi:hypothetical protein
MKPSHVQPWATGPGEILRHGLELLNKDSDTNRRLAMISIDNAVELMVKTYIGLPKRITGLSITRKELQEIGESFPAILDALEKWAPDRLDGIDLGTIEWYHRLRNELYHQGNGLTVERDKVEIYAELANVLFKNLFGYALVEDHSRKTELLGEFLAVWTEVERGLRTLVEREAAKTGQPENRSRAIFESFRLAHKNNLFSPLELGELEALRKIRNSAAHGEPGWDRMLTQKTLDLARRWAKKLSEKPD